MNLIRRDSNPHPKPGQVPDDHIQAEYLYELADEYDEGESAVLKVEFKRFGRGTENRSSFAVEINWVDAAAIIRGFIDARHPNALHLERVIRLASSVEKAGWSPNDPPNQDFYDILL